MGIYIKDLELPECCDKCPFKKYIGSDQLVCGITGYRFYAFDVGWGDKPYVRHESCQLVEIPHHGRLIDADEFVKLRIDWYCENCERRKNSNGRFVYEIGGVPCRACDIGDMIDAVDDAPTVVEGNYPPSVPLEQVWTELFGEDGE